MKTQNLLLTLSYCLAFTDPEQEKKKLSLFEYYNWPMSGPKWSESEPNIRWDFPLSVMAIK